MTSVIDLGVEARSVADIERKLAQLRRSADARASEGVALPARAAVLTLVVYATRRAHAERAAETIGRLADHHPSRALILFEDARGGAHVRVRCHLPQAAARRVSYEQIVVRTPDAVPHLLRSVTIPLVIADLPVFLWWTGTPPVGSAHFHELLALAHRLVVDSADFARPDLALPELWRLGQEGDGRFGVTDLNWTRVTAWRELIAQFFDVREWRPFLDSVTGLRIGFSVDMDGREIHPSQALLLVGWLAARLGWRSVEQLAPSEAGGLLFRMVRPDGAPLWVRIRPRFLRGVDEGNVTGVRILCDRDGTHAEFVIKRDEDGTPHADTEAIAGGDVVMHRTVFLPTPSVVDLLGEELTITRSDTVYEAALGVLVELTTALR